MQAELERARRESARWYILRALDAGRPQPVAERLIGAALAGAGYPLSDNELRRELDYLRDRRLIVIADDQAPVWLCDMTRYGVDIVEYTIACEPGIARPPLGR